MISIIVPVYNVENYLGKCIDSIINQSFYDIEIILIDDGSTDNSGKICDQYKLKDNRIKVIHKINGGLSSARNCGLDIAKGEYIGFVDSDDYIDKYMYEKMINNLKENNSDIVICDMNYYLNGTDISNNKFRDFGVLNREDTLLKYLNHSYFKSHAQNKLYKKYLFNNLRFPEGKLFEDVATFYKVIGNSNRISFVNEKLYYYNQGNGNSITKKKFNLKNLDLIDNVEDMLHFFCGKYSNDVVQAAEGFYYLSVNTVIDMLYSNGLSLTNREYVNMMNTIENKVNKTYYKRGLKYFVKNNDVSYVKSKLNKLSFKINYYILKHLIKTGLMQFRLVKSN
ncbi:glycosyltransferase [Clostridium sp. SM-530-WT-3G]|uniref:glycosyltransferase family 2 protein n=1 Tax=Clostridium sp. SM-530-WT-3G TaxID=2725303 RepID=UPI00145F86BC|nr:glycosyltransferase [Clostridium sp. SM-530-WT-3G]NME82447.1 glycosyltransferase [Clostridium sp. SM-530-WT-3G]